MKRTFQPSKRKRKISTDLEKEWPPLAEEKYSHPDVQREEKSYRFPLNQDIKNK